jgi:hypothetical protein
MGHYGERFQRNGKLFKFVCVQLTQHVDTKKLTTQKINRTQVLHISTQNGALICISFVCYFTILSVSRLYSMGNRIVNEYGLGAGMESFRGNQSTRRLPAPKPLCPPWIPHDLICNQTWVSCYIKGHFVLGSKYITYSLVFRL